MPLDFIFDGLSNGFFRSLFASVVPEISYFDLRGWELQHWKAVVTLARVTPQGLFQG
jgi:hypothetical protein